MAIVAKQKKKGRSIPWHVYYDGTMILCTVKHESKILFLSSSKRYVRIV